jgi:hypothetical protein
VAGQAWINPARPVGTAETLQALHASFQDAVHPKNANPALNAPGDFSKVAPRLQALQQPHEAMPST